MTGYTDYVHNLDKLTVYVTSKPQEDTDSLQVHKLLQIIDRKYILKLPDD